MTTKRDYYEILGIAKEASPEDVKKAYRSKALKFHPDRVPPEKKTEAEEKFKEISEAYAVLVDAEKRKLYDTYGHAGIDSRFSEQDIFRNADFSNIFGDGFGSMFEGFFQDLGFDLFGSGSGHRGSSRRYRGRDLETLLDITLEEVAQGIEKTVSFSRNQTCQDCKGQGQAPGSKKITCPVCRGSGTIYSSAGFIRFGQTCLECKGQGKVITKPCPKCRGDGLVKVKKSLKVKVPAGIRSGSSLRIRSEGDQAQGGSGDLYVTIRVKPHQKFKRQDNDLLYETSISLVRAVLGVSIDVPTIEGKVNMSIPAGTQPGSVFRLKGKGLIDIHSQRKGDEFVRVNIQIPKKLSAREKALFEELAKLKGESSSCESLKDKIKKAFK